MAHIVYGTDHIRLSTYEPRSEKTGFLHICENKEADQLRGK